MPYAGGGPTGHAAVQRLWRKRWRLSSVGAAFLDAAEQSLERAGFDKGPWFTVLFAVGIGSWFILPTKTSWLLMLAACAIVATFAFLVGRKFRYAQFGMVVLIAALAMAGGLATVWARSTAVGAAPIAYPQVVVLEARVLEREEQPARDRVRLTLATRVTEKDEKPRAVKVRINVPLEKDNPGAEEGAHVRLKARLMPPAPPILPGAYDFARAAWFQSLSATGTLIGDLSVVEPAREDRWLAWAQRALSLHVRENVTGSPGSIASALASGDRGAISDADEEAMRDSGLTHLLSISGLHVSALIGAAYLVSIKILALFPAIALRIRLPLVAAAVAAGAGVGYTLLTGAEVPTVRSCIAALLVLTALVIGREPLSMRMIAIAAFLVLLVWPEALIGPSFQMSFSAVIAIVALHRSAPVVAFLAPREEPPWQRVGRRTVMLFVTGLVIELALMPIVLFHFHRAGVYGAFANVMAIPLVTFVTMPLLALALLLDVFSMGWLVWWAVDGSLQLLIALARFVAEQPGAVKMIPQMTLGTVLVIVAGLIWLALWQGRYRLLGLIPVFAGTLATALTPLPDLLVTRDGRHVGVILENDRLLVLREGRGGYAQENLRELSGVEGDLVAMDEWPFARCNRDFCAMTFAAKDGPYHVLMSRGQDYVEERALAAACARSHIVISDRWLPRSCRPIWLKADRRYLADHGGLAIQIDSRRVRAVADRHGEHGW